MPAQPLSDRLSAAQGHLGTANRLAEVAGKRKGGGGEGGQRGARPRYVGGTWGPKALAWADEAWALGCARARAQGRERFARGRMHPLRQLPQPMRGRLSKRIDEDSRGGLGLLLTEPPADAPPVKEQPAPAPPAPAPLALEYAGPRDAFCRPLVGDGLSRGAPVAALRIGNRVEIHGVALRGAQFNGMLGNVRSVLGCEMFGVEVEQVGRVLSFHSRYLRFMEKGTALDDTRAWPSAEELRQQQEKRLANEKARGARYKQQEAQLQEWFGRWWGRDTAHVELARARAARHVTAGGNDICHPTGNCGGTEPPPDTHADQAPAAGVGSGQTAASPRASSAQSWKGQVFVRLNQAALAKTVTQADGSRVRTGATKTLEVSSADTVLSVKQQLQQLQLQGAAERLLFAGKELPDDATLAECGVSRGSTLDALPRCRGGGGGAAPVAAASAQNQQHAPPSRVVLQLGHSGLGLFISKEGPGPFVITGLIPGGAAVLSGQMRVGDLLHAIGTTSLYELSEQQAKALIRGTPGPGVTLWIARAQAHLESTPRNINPEAQVRLKHTSLSAFTPGSTALESGLNVCV